MSMLKDGNLDVAVVCDDYKFSYWLQELKKSKWKITYAGPGVTANTRTIKISVPPAEMGEVKPYLQKMEVDFKRSN